jgi:hypothetical protein
MLTDSQADELIKIVTPTTLVGRLKALNATATDSTLLTSKLADRQEQADKVVEVQQALLAKIESEKVEIERMKPNNPPSQQGVCKDCHKKKRPVGFLQKRKTNHVYECAQECHGDAECCRPEGETTLL